MASVILQGQGEPGPDMHSSAGLGEPLLASACDSISLLLSPPHRQLLHLLMLLQVHLQQEELLGPAPEIWGWG